MTGHFVSGENMECIAYKDGYKYQLREEYVTEIDILPEEDICTDYVVLTAGGKLTIRKSYAWDGPSGPAIDTLDFMRGSLVHDALYQLMRLEELDRDIFREPADRLLQKMCREDGMWRIRAWWVYLGVKFFADPAADPANKKPVIKAPEPCQ